MANDLLLNEALLRQLVAQLIEGTALFSPEGMRPRQRPVTPPQTVTVGRPLSEATPVAPLTCDYCPTCLIDLLTNPEATVVCLDPVEILVRCSCGRLDRVGAWLYT
jgi:hypothetical protein